MTAVRRSSVIPPEPTTMGMGSTNELERELHTDPEYADTDGDGLSYVDEIGNHPAVPRDTDKDGFPDAPSTPAWTTTTMA